MLNKEILRKQIIYRSMHRGTKEMDILLGSFVKTYINKLDHADLLQLKEILSIDDEILQKWYFDLDSIKLIKKTKISVMLKNFKL
jgi:antitoxin CptB